MPGRQAERSEETRRAILAAAGQLFSERGFGAVTMREIARAAGCSHTAIYIYFQDKEALLHQLAMGPLQALQGQFAAELQRRDLVPEERLRRLCQVFLQFGLRHRTMYSVLFMVSATRVDLPEPALAVNQLRNQLFRMLQQAVAACLPPGRPEDEALAYSRVVYFTVHGIITLYAGGEEPLETLMERLGTTFDLAVDVMLAGLKELGGKQA